MLSIVVAGTECMAVLCENEIRDLKGLIIPLPPHRDSLCSVAGLRV